MASIPTNIPPQTPKAVLAHAVVVAVPIGRVQPSTSTTGGRLLPLISRSVNATRARAFIAAVSGRNSLRIASRSRLTYIPHARPLSTPAPGPSSISPSYGRARILTRTHIRNADGTQGRPCYLIQRRRKGQVVNGGIEQVLRTDRIPVENITQHVSAAEIEQFEYIFARRLALVAAKKALAARMSTVVGSRTAGSETRGDETKIIKQETASADTSETSSTMAPSASSSPAMPNVSTASAKKRHRNAAVDVTSTPQLTHLASRKRRFSKQVKQEQDVGEQEWEIEALLAHRFLEGKHQYLVKWADYDGDEEWWLNEDNLAGAKDLIADYRKSVSTASVAASRQRVAGSGTMSVAGTNASSSSSTTSRESS